MSGNARRPWSLLELEANLRRRDVRHTEVMRAMLLEAARRPLRPAEVEPKAPGRGEVRIAVEACGVCRTDLHVADGELTDPKLPLILGHEIVGRIVERGPGAERFAAGDRVGV